MTDRPGDDKRERRHEVIGRRLTIAGRVHGVGYRDWLVAAARVLALDGWVRNHTDGRVEAVVRGSSDAVAAIIARAHDGPSAARVEAVTVAEDRSGDAPGGFVRRATA